jgi:hypothetical protein
MMFTPPDVKEPLMLNDKDSPHDALLIADVREATFDPISAESVPLALKVVLSENRTAAAGVSIIFAAERGEEVSVDTDDEGWARYLYTAGAPGNVAVTAKLAGSEEPLHTFRLKVLAAGFWDGAMFQFDTSEPAVWGQEAGFPRKAQRHTVWLKPAPGSPLIDRDICLGLKSYLSASALGLTVAPALGVSRPLTAEGLSWDCTGTGEGAYALQLAASRVLKFSPDNTMSLSAGLLPIPEFQVDARFDTFSIRFGGDIVYPCHGAVHTLTIPPTPELLGKRLKLDLVGPLADSLGVGMNPALDEAYVMTQEGITWEMDCRGTTVNGTFFLQVTVLEEGRTTEPLILSLGHNRVTAVRWSTGNYGNPPERGPYQVRHIRAESAYMRYFPVPGLNVLVNGVSSTEAITDRNGQYSESEQFEGSKNLTIINRYDGSIV